VRKAVYPSAYDWRHKVALLDREIEVIIRLKAGRHAERTVTVSAT
jgi:hypothetical protein